LIHRTDRVDGVFGERVGRFLGVEEWVWDGGSAVLAGGPWNFKLFHVEQLEIGRNDEGFGDF